MIVVDASVIAVALADDGPDGDTARTRLRGEKLAAPQLLDLEVASVFRRRHAIGAVDDRRAQLALDDLRAMPIQRAPHSRLVHRCWELRDSITVYDAAYVALAELLQATLLTADRRLAQVPGPVCDIETLQPSRGFRS